MLLFALETQFGKSRYSRDVIQAKIASALLGLNDEMGTLGPNRSEWCEGSSSTYMEQAQRSGKLRSDAGTSLGLGRGGVTTYDYSA